MTNMNPDLVRMLEFLDDAETMAAVDRGSSVATVSMSTNFLGAVKAGKRAVFARTTLMEDDRMVASAQATLLVSQTSQEPPQVQLQEASR